MTTTAAILYGITLGMATREKDLSIGVGVPVEKRPHSLQCMILEHVQDIAAAECNRDMIECAKTDFESLTFALISAFTTPRSSVTECVREQVLVDP